MSLHVSQLLIEEPESFFARCQSRAEVASQALAPAVRLFEQMLAGSQEKEHVDQMKRLIMQYPNLLSLKSHSKGMPLIHQIAISAKDKSLMELCVDRCGKKILEVGTTEHETTPLFWVTTYQALTRLTKLGADANVIGKKFTVLEMFALRIEESDDGREPGPRGLELRRCVKHLIGLGARLSEDCAHSLPGRKAQRVCEKFLEDIARVNDKIQAVAQHIPVKSLMPIIFDYVYEEEGSETPVYDGQRKYILDDETEAYPLALNLIRASSVS